jgi:hypothetical protein
MSDSTPQKPEDSKPLRGGLGGGNDRVDNGLTAIKDLRVTAEAVRNGWAIPDGVLEVLPAEVTRMFLNKNLGARERLRAAETIMKMHAQNQEHVAGRSSDAGTTKVPSADESADAMDETVPGAAE